MRKICLKQGALRTRGRQGSITVEAAVILPFTVLAVILMLYLCLYVHDRAWLTAAAEEAALCGSMEGVRCEGRPWETAEERARQLANTGLFGARALTLQVSAGEKVEVTYRLQGGPPFLAEAWKLTVSGRADILRPAGYLLETMQREGRV